MSVTSSDTTIRYTGLLHRLASISSPEFSKHWHAHAALAVPWFLFHGITGYTQTHTSEPSKYDGMVDLHFDPNTASLFNPERVKGKPGARGAQKYFEEVILPDEQRFWDRTGERNVKVEGSALEAGLQGWERKVIVDGEVLIELPEEVRQRWNEYIAGADAGQERV